MDKYIGKRLQGRYEIEELIGVGGMAYVYKAHDTLDDREVAVKILKDEFLSNEEFTRRFKNESKAISILSHPNIVKVYDVSFGDRLQYIVMEYIDGITLKEYIEQQNVTWKEAVHFTVQILRALQHAHDKGIIHRDIKPQNIMLLADGTIKVTDFGIAHFSRNEMRTGLGDKAIGSVHYISPEQARGAVTDEKADLYSVGIMMYEMLTGKLPFEADNAVSVAIMQLQSQPKKPTDINPDIPEGLEEITLKAMQKDPEKRYQSAAEMLQDINEFKQNPGIRFEYKYFVDETPTKYVEAISHVRGGDKEDEEDEGRHQTPILPILAAVAVALLIVAGLIVGVVGVKNGWFAGSTVSDSDPIVMPNFVGRVYSSIPSSELEVFAGNLNLAYAYDSSAAGTVIKQSILPNKSIRVNDSHELTLTLSLGPEMIKIPEIGSLSTQAQYVSLLNAAGLVADVKEISDDTVAVGYVVKTSPDAGSQVESGSTVTVYVSSGAEPAKQEEIPNIVGATQADAIKALEAKGFTVNKDNIQTVNDPSVAAGVVIQQSPEAGQQADSGTEVVLTVSSGYRDVNINIPLPSTSSVIDMEIFVDGKRKTEAQYYSDLQGLIPSVIGQVELTFTEQKSSYTVTVLLALSGTNQYQTYMEYSINGATGAATVVSSVPFDDGTTIDED